MSIVDAFVVSFLLVYINIILNTIEKIILFQSEITYILNRIHRI
jgi:hypothetical protein